MAGALFFLVPYILLTLTIIFSLCITEKVPEWLTVNIGKLDATDIRKMSDEKRNYLRRQVVCHFSMAISATLFIGLAFFIWGKPDRDLLAIPCNIIGLVVGAIIILPGLIKKSDALKDSLKED
jgi:hypothetical protein